MAKIDFYTIIPKTLNPIPPAEIMDAWKDDYTKMLDDMIYEENKPTFKDLIDNLNALRMQLNALEWTFELSFPIPDRI